MAAAKTGRSTPAHGRRRPAPPAPVRNFYRQALTEAEQEELPQAEQVEGLADEIAALRVRLKTALRARPDDLKLLSQGVEMLVKAVAAQYRLSPRAKRDLAENIAAVLNSLGDQLLPPS